MGTKGCLTHSKDRGMSVCNIGPGQHRTGNIVTQVAQVKRVFVPNKLPKILGHKAAPMQPMSTQKLT